MFDLEVSIKAMQAGILPAFSSEEIARLLNSCDPEEAYRLKRKFRKLWRKEMKAQLKNASTDEEAKSIGSSFSSPKTRRRYVKRMLEKQEAV